MTLYLLPSGDETWANELAETAQLSLCHVGTEPESKLHLVLSDQGLFLSDGNLSYGGDFTALLPRVKENKLGGELLVKAAKPKSFADAPRLFDATAGLGEDSFLLAAAGFQVTLCEQNPVIYALLADALKRGRENERLLPILSRMTLLFGDSIPRLQEANEEYDVVYLDPMFPARQKSGLVKKKFQLLQQLEAPDGNGDELFATALSAKPKKIIVKRPKNAPPLGGTPPSYAISGDTIRYDCIVL